MIKSADSGRKDVLLFSLAEVLLLPSVERGAAMKALKEDPKSGYNQEVGKWTSPPARKHEATSCEYMMQRLLSVLLNNLKKGE